jgi:glycolate oxidase FAD binding subunit
MISAADVPVVQPASAEATAHALADAAARRQNVVVRGGGTKWSWGRQPAGVDLILSTERLSRLLAHEEGDLTVDVEAGVTLRAVNEQLRSRNQWLPLESAFDAATIGGVLATNDAGALRHRFGTPRDLVIGMRLATTGGHVVRSGGHVVKNVAGYDLARLMTGSFGSLAVITSATFKLAPYPAAFGTLALAFSDAAAASAAAMALAATQLDPVALEVVLRTSRSAESLHVLMRFASTAAAVEAQIADAQRLAAGFAAVRIHHAIGADDDSIWRDHARRPWAGVGAVVRVSWLPASLPIVLEALVSMRSEGAGVELVARAGGGSGVLRIDAESQLQVKIVRELRERAAVFTSVTVLRAAADVTAMVDVWGSPGDTAALLAAVKRAFDPHGILNAERGPV